MEHPARYSNTVWISLKQSEKEAATTLRKKQRDALMKEIEARERAESNRREIEDRLKKMEEAFEASREELAKSKADMEKMQEQLAENQVRRESIFFILQQYKLIE